jgi:altronate dehydratase large subunit
MSTTVSSNHLNKFAESLSWHGFRRADGRVGIRNHRIVLSTVALTDQLASAIASQEKETICVSGAFSRGLQKSDEELVLKFIDNVLTHPNVGAALVVTHDAYSSESIAKKVKATIPIEYLAFMNCNGRKDALIEGSKRLKLLAERQIKFNQARELVGLSSVSIALECGGSDVSSSICTNPVIGDITDFVIKNGGSAIVSETAEFIGAEKIFTDRCSDLNIRQSILNFINYRLKLINEDNGKDYRGTNPTQENLDGGLTTLIEKSMGAVSKTGTTHFVSALEFGMSPKKPGLHFMDTPFFTPVSLTGMMMAGCNLGLFAMGVFNPSGNVLCPMIKICGNPKTAQSWQDDIDVALDGYFAGELSGEEAQISVLTKLNAVFNGAVTASEKYFEGQFLLPRGGDSL